MSINRIKDLEEKEKFIIDWMSEGRHLNCHSVDILNAQFVDDYIERFKPRFRPTNFGAYKCSELVRVLRKLYLYGKLERRTVGLPDRPSSDFPKWIYSYSIKNSIKK